MLEDYQNTTGYAFLRKDRDTGRRGGGLAICYNSKKIQMSKAKIPPSKHEIFAAVGRRVGQRRKIVTIVVYVPPWYNAQQNRSLYNATNESILATKRKYSDPYIVIAGDFNRRNMLEATRDYPDIKTIRTGPTRGDSTLDLIATNFNESLIDFGTTSPVYSADQVESDHMTVFAQFRMQKVPSYEIQKYSYYHMSEEGHNRFKEWAERQSWTEVTRHGLNVSKRVEILHNMFKEAMDQCYEWKTRVKKTSEPCWMADWIRDIIQDRRKIFKTDGLRSSRWKGL